MGHLDGETLARTWRDYKSSGDMGARNELVVHYTSLVKYVAAKVGGTLPAMVDRDDLVSYGLFGLIDAIDKFDIDKGVKFETYGMARIRGAIYDEIRALDWVPRSVRSKAKDIDKARSEVEALQGRPGTHDEIALHLGLSHEAYWELVSQSVVSQVGSLAEGDDAGGNAGSVMEYSTKADHLTPETMFEAGEIVDLLGEAVNTMDERSKTILVLYYLQEMTLAEIGRILGVTESRVCQLQSRALLALRESLGRGGLVAA